MRPFPLRTVPIIALMLAASSAVAWGQIHAHDPLTQIDPTNKNSDITRATGYKIDFGVIFPPPSPPGPSQFGDPNPPGPVIYRIDGQTGDVSESTPGGVWKPLGVKATPHEGPGNRYWEFHGVREPIPPNVDKNGIAHLDGDINIYLTNRFQFPLRFTVHYSTPRDFQKTYKLRKNLLLDPGKTGHWLLDNETGIGAVVDGNKNTLYRVMVTAYDPNTIGIFDENLVNGKILGRWGVIPGQSDGLPAVRTRSHKNIGHKQISSIHYQFFAPP